MLRDLDVHSQGVGGEVRARFLFVGSQAAVGT